MNDLINSIGWQEEIATIVCLILCSHIFFLAHHVLQV